MTGLNHFGLSNAARLIGGGGGGVQLELTDI